MCIIDLFEVKGDVLTPTWRKSSYSAHDGACVEVVRADDRRIAVRDSKNPAGTPVVFSARSWASFVDDLKHDAALG